MIAKVFASHDANIIPIYALDGEWSNQNSTNSNVVLTIDELEVVKSYRFCRKKPNGRVIFECSASALVTRSKITRSILISTPN